MDLRETRDALVLAMLPHVPFDGWSRRSMGLASVDTGHDAGLAERVFPGGAVGAIEHFSDLADRRLVLDVADAGLPSLRVRERIARLVRGRVEPWASDREAIRRGLSMLALPGNAAAALRATYRTADAIWYLAGDTATDFSYYTKRATLAGVYTSTVFYWIEDASEGFEETWGFLERRIDDLMRISRIRARLPRPFEALPDPMRLFARRSRVRRRFGVRAD